MFPISVDDEVEALTEALFDAFRSMPAPFGDQMVAMGMQYRGMVQGAIRKKIESGWIPKRGWRTATESPRVPTPRAPTPRPAAAPELSLAEAKRLIAYAIEKWLEYERAPTHEGMYTHHRGGHGHAARYGDYGHEAMHYGHHEAMHYGHHGEHHGHHGHHEAYHYNGIHEKSYGSRHRY